LGPANIKKIDTQYQKSELFRSTSHWHALRSTTGSKYHPTLRRDLTNSISGGPEVAEHARVNLISTINRRLGICDDFEQAIKDAMIEEDTTIRQTGMLQPGSTAALALVDVKRGTVVVGDLGDSHVVLAERNSERKGDWKAKCLSYAQKPWSKEERERIHDAGGKLNRVYGETRLGEFTCPSFFA
jgi:serine/threonine protein phosphatase PrpC